MKKNMGSADKVVRIILAAVIATLYFMDIIPGTIGIVLMVLAGIFVLTSFISFCPLYAPFGISTCKKKGWVGSFEYRVWSLEFWVRDHPSSKLPSPSYLRSYQLPSPWPSNKSSKSSNTSETPTPKKPWCVMGRKNHSLGWKWPIWKRFWRKPRRIMSCR